MDSALLRSVFFGSRIASLTVVLLTVCSTSSSKPAAATPVRNVDCGADSKLEAFAERARQTGNRFYTAVCALLADGKGDPPQQFDICFKKKLPHRHSGEARFNTVCLNLQYLEAFKDLATLDYILVHEMTHVAQHYYRPIVGGLVMYNSNPPFSWQEGIADYVCFKLGLTNGWECAECSGLFPHYRNGYGCAGAFLLYLEGTYGSNIVRQLNTALRQALYTDEFFRQTTGKELPALWADFQRTRGFTAGAARMLELQRTLGFKDGKPPKGIERRLSLYLEQHADVLSPRNLEVTFPAERSFTATKEGDPSAYHYTVIRPSSASSWQLQRAWRTDAEGQLADEYSVE
jgi:hypothetical protein